MTKRHKTVSSLQAQLKSDIYEAITGKITEICTEIVQDNVRDMGYIQKSELTYDRTWELLNSVTVGNLYVGTKQIKFEVFMDTDKIGSYVKDGDDWNQHASVDPMDVSEYIPLWVEEGTEGSLYDREGAHYMENSHLQLDGGLLARELAKRLKQNGWKVITT
ncbi:hypothetical protein [Viridibacillus arvi]|uniref:hypothetical protein n=1 Tax=Viridibacillus arvi TaxID=263475 RepID=UPI0034CEDBBA